MSNNKNLHDANVAKQDEFYTQLRDIENELKHYKKHFANKIIFCNCDDPYESNFFKYFAINFNSLKLKKLITTCYGGSPIITEQLSLFDVHGLVINKKTEKSPYKLEINEVVDSNNDGAIDLSDVEYLIKNKKNTLTLLKENGDFRSNECIKLLEESDIVVTNPPFSLFREYIALLMNYKKKFIIIGNQNAVSYKEFFPLIKENKVWLGYNSGGQTFRVPETFDKNNTFRGDDGKKYAKFGNMILYKKYNSKDYQKYDNYDAIEVGKVSDIPSDYMGVMGVPITFVTSHNPNQFKIVGLTSGRYEFESQPIKKYVNPVQHNPNGTTTNGSKANTRATIKINYPEGVYYTADNVEGKLEILYARILIQRINNNEKEGVGNENNIE